MTDSQADLSPEQQVTAAREAFEQEFERFARFTAGDREVAVAEERALADLRTRHLGKKSALAATKKLVGRVAPDERATFGQLVQQADADITHRIELAERNLKQHLDSTRVALEAVDVTLPGRRPRQGHLHPLTII